MLGFFPTTSPAMQELVDRMRMLEQRPDVLAVSLIHGFPWSDTSDTGAGVIVATDENSANAEALATELAQRFVHARYSTPQLVDVNTALDQAESAGPGPVVIADVCDNAGGGAPGDSTFLLDALLRRNIGNAALALLWDPEAVNIATDAGQGAQLSVRIGGKTAVTSGPPLDVLAEVVRIVESPHQRGLSGDEQDKLGRSALLRIGPVQVVINSIRQQVFSPDCFTQFGVNLAEQRVLVVKSSQHFARQFQGVSDRFIYCQTPGCLTFDFGSLPYRNLRRPMWPIDAVDPLITTELVERRRRP
jgi:microcystin degradation protein MlrC